LSKSMIHPLRSWFAQPRAQMRLKCATVCSAAMLLLHWQPGAKHRIDLSTVRDTGDALVPGAKVTLINESSKAIRTRPATGGFFNFLAVQPATYSIRVQKRI